MIRKMIVTLALCSLSASLAAAYGPIFVTEGEPVVWRNLPLTYHVDLGALGDEYTGGYTNEEATELTDDSFAAWSDVPTTRFTAVNGGHLPVDVTVENYTQYLSNFDDGINPVVFDSDGQIIDQLFGAGASNFILGYTMTAANMLGRALIETEVLINGVPTAQLKKLEIMATIVHELGHMAGLDHTQINGDLAFSGNPSDTFFVPTMYPLATQNDEPLSELNPDDEAGITMLYPNEKADAHYGILKGTLKRGMGEPVLGANMLARMMGDELWNTFSTVSDYMELNTGEWEMRVVPGSYRLSIEPINPLFYGGSGVGPYANSPSSLSFQNPVAPQEFSKTFNVAAGQTLDGINIEIDPVNHLINMVFDSDGPGAHSAAAPFQITTRPCNDFGDCYPMLMAPVAVWFDKWPPVYRNLKTSH